MGWPAFQVRQSISSSDRSHILPGFHLETSGRGSPARPRLKISRGSRVIGLYNVLGHCIKVSQVAG
jgi:hypothetical protein